MVLDRTEKEIVVPEVYIRRRYSQIGSFHFQAKNCFTIKGVIARSIPSYRAGGSFRRSVAKSLGRRPRLALFS